MHAHREIKGLLTYLLTYHCIEGWHVKHVNTVFNMTTLHCND